MANEQQQPRIGSLRKLAALIQGNSDDLYRSTYYADPDNKQQLRAIKTDITNTIKDIIDTTTDNIGEPNISKLYERLYLNSQNDKSTISEFDKIFGDNEFVNNLTASYLDNRWIKAVDTEIDEVLKYMTKLQEALDTITDNVLSADSFSKDYLNLTNDLANSTITGEQFDRNIKELKKKYDLLKLIKKIYKNTSKYGECFVYRVPYEKAIQKLLDRRDNNRTVTVKTTYGESGSVIVESAELGSTSVSLPQNYALNEKTDGVNIKFEIESGIISSIVDAAQKSYEKLGVVQEQSLFHESIYDIENIGRAYAYDRTMDNDIKAGGKLPVHHRFDQTLGDKLELPGEDDTTADGLYDTNKKNQKIKSMNGTIVKILERERVVPILLNDVCLGYYYFEYDAGMELFDERLSSTGLVNTITGLRSNGRSEAFDALQRREELIRNIAAELAEKIDNKFVDNNQDLKKEIYYILKYNDEFNAAAGSANNIRVSYIPPEDIKHFYFELDDKTGRGISDLHLSLIPAKLWVAIYLTNSLAIMTRGNDKRVYYVRQSVETNIAKTLLKTINEVKKANFGIRQIENINSVLNITGRFNDYIIPRGADGQSPIEFEVMQGQQIEIKTELLNILEESAINVTGVPIETIQNRQSPEYAMQLTMSNSKFIRFVYERQSDFQTMVSDFVTDLYDIEFSTKDRVTLTLPPPLFINITNTDQLLSNVMNFAGNVTEIMMPTEPDDIKTEFKKEVALSHLGSYINLANIRKAYDKAMQQKAKKEIAGSGDEGEDNGGGY